MAEQKKIWTLEEIVKEVKGPDLFSANPKMGYAGITDSDDRWKRLWKIIGPNQYEEIDLEVKGERGPALEVDL